MPFTKMPIREGKRSPCDRSMSNKGGNLKVSKRKRDDPHNTDIPPAKKAEINVNFQKPLKVDDLSQEKLLEGMVVLGCVQEVRDTYLKINLPGQVLSYVPASNISEEFDAYVTSSLSGEEKVSKDLTQIFKPGQHVITKVVEITKTGSGKLRMILSLKPNLIYDDLSINDIRSGFTFSASVQSIEDNGYKMNCGIPGVTAFLRKSQAANFEQIWNDGRLLEIGQVIRCLVTKFNKSEECLNIKLQADPETVANQVVEEIDVPVKSLFIGMHFKMIVSKITSSGLVVKFLENKTGYVHSNYLKMNFRTLNVGDVLLGRVLYIESLTEKIYLTALENVCGPFLSCPFKNIQKGQKFMEAKVVSSKEGNILLELEENSGIYGYVTKQYLNVDDEHKISEIVKERYPKGSFHACKVLGYDYMMQKYSCILRSELKEIMKGDSLQKNSNSLKVGKPYIVYVQDVSPEGLIVQEQDSGIKGWIPLPQLTDYPPLAKVLCHTYRKGDELHTYCLSYANKVLFTASPTFIKYFQSLQGKELTKKGHSQLKENMVIPCTVTEITAAGIVVRIPMQGETCLVNVASDNICDGTVDVFSLGLEKYQSFMVQILQVSREGPSSGSSCFSRVTKGTLMSESGLMLLQNYMNCQKKICNFWKSEEHPIGELCVGSQVKGTVVAISSLGAVINLDNGTQAVVMPTHYESLNIKKDMPVEGTVMFVDVVNKCVEISLEKEVQDIFASLGKLPDVGYNSKCYVLVSRPDITLCSITYNNAKNIVYVPSRWHINDLRPSPYFSVGDHSKITIRMNDDHLIYAVPQKLEILEKNNENDCEIIMNDINSIENNIQKIDDISEFELGSEEKKEKKRKRKVKVMEEDTNGENACPESKIVESSNDVLPDVNKSLMNGCENLTEYVKSETKDREKSRILNTHQLEENKKKNRKKNKNLVKKNVQNDGCEPLVKENTTYLNVNAGFVWNATPDLLPVVAKQKTEDVSSSDEEIEVTVNKKKKQRLTMAEKRELASQEEERLRKIEERLMNAEKNPVSADDFDRLVMSAPNDSKNWIKYMAYHLEATEVGKARAVAERALKTISFREEQEKFNVWMALLNLENLYGTPESLDKTIEEAVKFNDSYKVHMQVLNMFSVTKKLEELDKLLQLITKKYKDQKNTWVEAGLACMKCGEIEKSRQLMQRALKVLNKRDHIEILTRFARMENEWGESERAETLMENILTSYTRRVDVWMMYIDMLIKSKKIDVARQVLDRAVIQKLPVMKMKALFKRYLQFEQIHGTPDRVQKVREMAKSYIENYVS